MTTEPIDQTAVAEEEQNEEDHPKVMETLKDSVVCRKEKRKLAKKLKRKQIRKEIAEKEQAEEEARLNDLEEQRKLRLQEQEEAETMERQRKEFEEREKLWLEKAAKQAAEEAQRKLQEEEEVENGNELSEDDDWEYVEDGPAEIIWQGNEIIVKKKRVRVPKQSAHQLVICEGTDRPTSNPLPPQSEVFASYNNSTAVSSEGVYESVASQIPNFGTEQDKANCPFHIKTGACRFGSRCSRVHFYPDKSCTLLVKNMYNGPGLAWEQDEGLEHTDEEVERSYEEFYEDVHTEFMKFGELVNFKVCRNGSFHLRGNVYVHFKSLESAILAYNSINARYFAGKQITCEFVGVTRWKVAICGEYMKSRLKNCSRGTACNFIHCFRNPGGDYEWADWDKPPPRYWVKKMASLFGPSDESKYDKYVVPQTVDRQNSSAKNLTPLSDRYPSRRSRSRTVNCSSSASSEEHSDDNRNRENSHSRRPRNSYRTKWERSSSVNKRNEENSNLEDDRYHNSENFVDRHGDQKRSRSREYLIHSSNNEDFVDDRNRSRSKEHRHSSRKRHSSRSDRHSSRSDRHSSRRDDSSLKKEVPDYENMKPGESPGRYDPNSRQITENNPQSDHCEPTSVSEKHEKPRSSSSSHDHKSISEPHDRKRSRHHSRSSSKKHSNSREVETDSSDEEHHFENNQETYNEKSRGSNGHRQRKRKI